MARAGGRERGLLSAAPLLCEEAARREAAARRQSARGRAARPGWSSSRGRPWPAPSGGSQQAARVGMVGARTICRAVPLSTMRPAYITAIRSATSTATPMSWVTKIIAETELALQLAQQEQDLDLHGGVERRGRLVGEQHARAAGQRQRDHGALAHAARHLVRIGVEPPRRRGNAHALEQLERAAPRPRQRRSLVAADRSRRSAGRW